MKIIYYAFLLLICFSCIPLRIAPNLEEGKVYKPKRFKRSLPKQHTYVFTDPKDANEFYYYINSKYQSNQNYDIEDNNIPILINDIPYYISFYEIEKTSKTLNLIPIVLDAAITANDNKDPLFEDAYTSRTGHWYIVLTISDVDFNDALDPTYEDSNKVISYATSLQEEYFTTTNYNNLLLKKAATTN